MSETVLNFCTLPLGSSTLSTAPGLRPRVWGARHSLRL